MTQTPQTHLWHAETSEQAFKALSTRPEGLSLEESAVRLVVAVISLRVRVPVLSVQMMETERSS